MAQSVIGEHMKKSDIIKELLDDGKSIEDIAIQLECKESVVKSVRTKYEKEKACADEPTEIIDDNQDDDGDITDDETISPEIVETLSVLDEILESVSEPDVEELPDVETEEVEVEEHPEDGLLETLQIRLKKRGLGVKGRKIRHLRALLKNYRENGSDSAWTSLCRGYNRYKRSLDRIPEVKDFFEKLAKKEGR